MSSEHSWLAALGARLSGQRTGRTERRLALLATVLALLIIRRLWLAPIGSYLVVADPPQAADALVPLAGDRERVIDAARLFEQGWARWYVVTATAQREGDLPYAEAIRHKAIELGVPAGRIQVVAEPADSTYSEAVFLRRLAQSQGWRSLMIITSPYHTRRSRLIFAEIFRSSGITIVVRPVAQSWYDPAAWWQTGNGSAMTVQEYFKLLLYITGYHHIDGLALTPPLRWHRSPATAGEGKERRFPPLSDRNRRAAGGEGH